MDRGEEQGQADVGEDVAEKRETEAGKRGRTEGD